MNSERLDKDLIDKILHSGMRLGAEFCDIYYEHRIQNTITLDENKIKDSKFNILEGVGVRVLIGEKIGYAFSDIIDETALLKAAESAAYIAKNSGNGIAGITPVSDKEKFRCEYDIPGNEETGSKTDLLLSANDAARNTGKEIIQVNCAYYDEFKRIEIANSEGLWKSDEQSVTNMVVSCIAQNGNVRDVGRSFIGGRYPFSYYRDADPSDTGEKAAQQAITKLKAVPAPAGMLPVVIKSGWGGVLVHEAVGHGLELDFNRKKTSLYSDRMGQEVASPLVTIIDDGTIPNGRGTLNFDDEGTPVGKTVLIEKGRLVGLMSDRLNSGLMDLPMTGNGRRMSFREYILPRMTNTYIDSGKSNPGDLIKDIQKGVYAAQLGGGQVDITTGNFVFEISDGYLIENGEITTPIRGANLIGNGPDSMKKVQGVGNDLRIETATGTCGKDGQSVYVGVGQPTIYISEMTVGGTGN
ncbi:MAG: TldD/PmbA family protein [bacterium]|nr:TldD/PmbA family protein [bacterium]